MFEDIPATLDCKGESRLPVMLENYLKFLQDGWLNSGVLGKIRTSEPNLHTSPPPPFFFAIAAIWVFLPNYLKFCILLANLVRGTSRLDGGYPHLDCIEVPPPPPIRTRWGTSGGSKGGHEGRAPPPGPKFLHFHAVFGNNWPNNRLAPPLWAWHPLLWEILDPPLGTLSHQDWVGIPASYQDLMGCPRIRAGWGYLLPPFWDWMALGQVMSCYIQVPEQFKCLIFNKLWK